jgi:hypothetical protein
VTGEIVAPVRVVRGGVWFQPVQHRLWPEDHAEIERRLEGIWCLQKHAWPDDAKRRYEVARDAQNQRLQASRDGLVKLVKSLGMEVARKRSAQLRSAEFAARAALTR